MARPAALLGSLGLMAVHSSSESSSVRGLNHGLAVRLNEALTDGDLVAMRPKADSLCSLRFLSVMNSYRPPEEATIMALGEPNKGAAYEPSTSRAENLSDAAAGWV